MKIRITCDSTADLSPDILAKLKVKSIKVLPIHIMLGDTEYLDSVNITPDDVYDYFDKTGKLPTTSSPNPVMCREFFEEALKEDGGHDAVIHFSVSKTMSGTYDNCVKAGANLPVYVVDSMQFSAGITLQMLYAQRLIEQGLSAEEVFNKVAARSQHALITFLVGVIKFLHKGGRCSGLAAFGANLLGIRPGIILEKTGKMVPGKKFNGKDMYKKWANDALKTWNNFDPACALVVKTVVSDEDFNSVKDIVKPHFAQICEGVTGCTITTHCGKGTIGIAYYTDGKQN